MPKKRVMVWVRFGASGMIRGWVPLSECTAYVQQAPGDPPKRFQLAEPQDLRILASVLPYDILGGGA